MTATQKLIDRVKEHQKIGSDYAAAKMLSISRSRISRYRKGHDEIGDEDVLFKAAELTGQDPALVIAEFRADSAKSEKVRRSYQKLADLARSAAQIGVMSLAVKSAILSPPTLPFSEGNEQFSAVYYVKRAQRKLRARTARPGTLKLPRKTPPTILYCDPDHLPLFRRPPVLAAGLN